MLSELFSKLELVSKAKSLLVGVSREGLPLSGGGGSMGLAYQMIVINV